MRLSLALCAAVFAAPAFAEPLSPVKTAELSARLFATGVDLQDPLLILSAAKLRKALNPVEGNLTTQASGETPLTWQDMLAAAEPLAEGDDTLTGLIADIRAESTKGVATGPVYNIGTIGNGKSDTYPSVDFIGGEYAEVYVEAKGATDLNLTVTDAKGRLVCSDTDRSHIAYCGWRPDRTEAYQIKVENRGPNGTGYALMTN
ncbi:hypothetical protein ACSBLW_15330 [Thioclava sp. FR2]|uniref:hypothetical protein n=1 Tax=Thioclava sp. FR2 TaxID=3445780 RepID=UPI003EC0FAFB